MTHLVAVIDDDKDIHEVCTALLEPAGWRCVCFASAREAVERARAGRLPPVALVDLALPGEDAMATIAAIVHHQPTHVVVLTGTDPEGDRAFEAISAGAVGYVTKNDALHKQNRLAAILDEVVSGGSPISPRIARRIINRFAPPKAAAPAPDAPQLTQREIELLAFFREGHTYDDCAAAMGVSVNTVRSFVREIYRKLQVATKTEAVMAAVRLGLIPSAS